MCFSSSFSLYLNFFLQQYFQLSIISSLLIVISPFLFLSLSHFVILPLKFLMIFPKFSQFFSLLLLLFHLISLFCKFNSVFSIFCIDVFLLNLFYLSFHFFLWIYPSFGFLLIRVCCLLTAYHFWFSVQNMFKCIPSFSNSHRSFVLSIFIKVLSISFSLSLYILILLYFFSFSNSVVRMLTMTGL